MTTLPAPSAMDEIAGPVDDARFAAIRAAAKPVLLRGQVADWPAVAAARAGDEAIVAYLSREPSIRPVQAIAAPPSEGGRFFYTPDLMRLNFMRGSGRFELFLKDLMSAAAHPQPPAMAVQSEDLPSLLPGFSRDNRLALLPDVPAKIWIGNRIKVGTHYDAKENVACCVAGERRFTLFPPEHIVNLYPGPFELTPAGIPVSMVDPHAPDLAQYPRFAEAAKDAQAGTLQPGDAIYIPYGWWHAVESLSPVSMLVNYWWTPGHPEGIGSPYEALLHAMLSLRHLPPEHKSVWRGIMEYYVFESAGDPSAHLPPHAKGVIGPPSAPLFAQMKEIIRDSL
jgi:hypothetical protein